MDTSETYIKMCEKAEEIQERPHPNPYIDSWSPNAVAIPRIGYSGSSVWAFTTEGYVWLPLQDQLQEMLLPDPNRKDAWGEPMPPDPKDDNVFWLFHDFAENIQERKYSQQTGEQLWLAFVMFELYHKKWYNGEWRVENDRDTKNNQDAPFRGEIHQSNMP